jgi:hypothetical protein
MSTQQQRICPTCGPVLAVKNSPPTCAEHVGMGMLAALTCGLGLVFVVPWALYRGVQSSYWHCQQCGSQC